MRKSTHPFFQLLMLAFLFLLMLFVSSVLSLVLSIPDGKAAGDEPVALGWQAVVQVLSFALPAVFVGVYYYGSEWRSYLQADFSGRRWLLGLAGVVVLLLLLPFNDWLTVWNDAMHLPSSLSGVEDALRSIGEESQNYIMLLLRGTPLWLSLLCVAVVPAVCEELFFRAGVQNLLMRWWAPKRADGSRSAVAMHLTVWVSAIIFSLFHGEVFAFLPRLLLGALLGYLYVGSGSLVANMLVHCFNNAMVVLVSWLYYCHGVGMNPSTPLELGWALTLACSLAAVALFVVTFGKRLKNL